MGRIDQETVQRILDTADIVDVVSDFVKLRRSGANYKGLCPFHNERTPSFSVNKARNICKCFSCGKGGSPVGFIMEHEQMSYNEALRYLARKYNIEIVERELSDSERQQANKREAMLAVNAFALDHFRNNLLHTDEGQTLAMPYFRHRGINDAMIERFNLGYAIDRLTELLDAARGSGFSDTHLIETGLEAEGKHGLYDRFHGRVIFPIHSLSGRVVGFGGRTMRSNKDIAKYVNSPESEIYKKKNELYGLYQARSAIGRRDKCIMVEGYLDVISMHQAGIENVVASSGTSLTEEQIRTVHRFTENVTLIYDADAAGIKASLRGINMLLAEKMNVKVLALPPGDDPDSFAQSHSSTEVEQYLAENEKDIIAFMTEKLMSGINPSDPMAKAKVVNQILQSVAWVDEPVKRQEYIALCSRMLDVPEGVLINQLNIFITRRYEDAEKARQREAARQSIASIDKEEKPESPLGTQTPDAPATADSAQAADTVDTAPLLVLDTNHLKPYEKMLVTYVARYGLLYAFDVRQNDDSVLKSTVYDFILSELGFDDLHFTYPPFAALIAYFEKIRNEIWPNEHERKAQQIEEQCRQLLAEKRQQAAQKGLTLKQMEDNDTRICAEVEEWRKQQLDEFDITFGQQQLANSPDEAIRQLASSLIVDRYSLSKIYQRHGHVESEQDSLSTLVPRAINELRSAVIAANIAALNRSLAALPPGNDEHAMQILASITQWKEVQKQLGKVLGERIILPN